MALSHSQVNMDGSNDPFYRYKMPALIVKVEGSSKMRKSVLVNLTDVCRKIGRPADHLITYLGQNLNASTKVEKGTGKAYVTGIHSAATLQSYVLKFIQDAVTCHHCNNPETSCRLEGKKKSRVLYLACKACQKQSDLDSDDRFVKFMMQHLPEECSYGHAGNGGAIAAEATCSPEEFADAPPKPRKEKLACPNCGHKTSKAECRKCGTSCLPADCCSDIQNTDNDDFDDLDGLVKHWMGKSNSVSPTSVGDLNDWLLSQGHINAKPIEKLPAVVKAAATEACAAYDFISDKLKPKDVAAHVQSTTQKYQPLIEGFYDQVGDGAAAAKSVVYALQMMKGSAMIGDLAVVGILLCLRELVDVIDDGDLASACHSLPDKSVAMRKFVDFLEEDPESDA